MTALSTLAEAAGRAADRCPSERPYLDEIRAMLSGERLLTVGQVAEILGVSSPTTVRNWLERGQFPGVLVTSGGHRRFRLADVLAVRGRMDLTTAENASGIYTDADAGDEDPYATKRRRMNRAQGR
jgi:excisionase family DNA binding protein